MLWPLRFAVNAQVDTEYLQLLYVVVVFFSPIQRVAGSMLRLEYTRLNPKFVYP